jgi:NhaA family Na+:H+ antiporter
VNVPEHRETGGSARRRAQIKSFLKTEAASGVLLLFAAVIALALANSNLRSVYHRVWDLPIGTQTPGLDFERSLGWWINDGLMTLFFFMVGLEIRREIHSGELAQWRRAAVPVAAALGGLSLPALIYLLFAKGPAARAGWGVPMATDIAFAVGILALLGSRVPPAMRVLLLALAIIDDIGAILVIAVFYSSGLSLVGCLVAVGALGVVLILQRLRVEAKPAYVLPALALWGGVYAMGVHPTIAGVVLGLVTPVTPLSRQGEHDPGAHASPAGQLIHALHPWVAFGIMPLFAFANAGVSLGGLAPDAVSQGVVTGVVVGLVLGKPIGIAMATWLTVRLGVGELPSGLGPIHVAVVGLVAGIGFTMALFVAELAFAQGPLLEAAKLGVLIASALAGLLTMAIGRLVLRPVASDV